MAAAWGCTPNEIRRTSARDYAAMIDLLIERAEGN